VVAVDVDHILLATPPSIHLGLAASGGLSVSGRQSWASKKDATCLRVRSPLPLRRRNSGLLHFLEPVVGGRRGVRARGCPTSRRQATMSNGRLLGEVVHDPHEDDGNRALTRSVLWS
jgi:hypothetical protein